jgi:ABC-type iron transport system FetAB ATPase subunit
VSRLRIEDLRFHRFGPIDLELEPAECVVVSGPSGSGKTLLLRAVADLDLHEGRVWLDDVECGSLPAPTWRRQVGLLPSESQWWRATVGAHLAAFDEAWLAELGFAADVLDWPIGRLSTGERARLGLLRLLAQGPRALLLDEPTANLDPENTQRVESLVAAFSAATAAPVLWVGHDREQAARVGDRQLSLEGGRLHREPRT